MYFASYDDKEVAKLQLSFNDIYFLEWFINWRISNKMLELPEGNEHKPDDKHYFWLKYSKIIEDLPALQMHNNVSVSNMLNRLCGKGKVNQNEYPLIRTFANINCRNKAYYATRPEVIAKMKGVQYTDGLFDEELINKIKPTKIEAKKSLGALLPNTEKILIELDKLKLPNKKLFSFTLPTDHKIYTKSMKKFQDALYDLYEGRFLSRHKMEDWFLEKNNNYITDETTKEINRCKGNWNQISMVLQCSANNYSSWFELDRETENKDWLTRDIGSFMFNPINNSSMFYITILMKASKTREVIAENMYNKLPAYISNKFSDFYNDEWDGLSYWKKIYDVYKWYKDNSEELIQENNNYRYWFQSVNDFMDGYYDFINMLSGTKYLKHFGINNPTWNWFISSKKEEHGIEE
jgi:hypothetical protein